MTEGDAQVADEVMECMILISDAPTRCLFDSGLTYSFVALDFAPKLLAFMEIGLSVSAPVGDSLNKDVGYKGCLVKINDIELSTDLVILDMKDFAVILGLAGCCISCIF